LHLAIGFNNAYINGQVAAALVNRGEKTMVGAVLLVFLSAGFLLSGNYGCTHSHTVQTLAPTSVATFVAREYSFDGPDTLPAGLTNLRLQNDGRQTHQIQLLKLTDGKKLSDLLAALQDQNTVDHLPRWARHMGGPNGISPGNMAEARIQLPPGLYVVTCLIPSDNGQPHVAFGMSKEVRVVDNELSAQWPLSHYHLAMRDYEFVLVETASRGTHSFYVKNRGTQPHQVSLIRLEPGASTNDFLGSFSDKGTLMPGQLIGGMAALEPDGDGAFTVTLDEGHYAFICLFPNPAAPSSHAARGMVMDFTVD
jgi:hypothetical protein